MELPNGKILRDARHPWTRAGIEIAADLAGFFQRNPKPASPTQIAELVKLTQSWLNAQYESIGPDGNTVVSRSNLKAAIRKDAIRRYADISAANAGPQSGTP